MKNSVSKPVAKSKIGLSVKIVNVCKLLMAERVGFEPTVQV